MARMTRTQIMLDPRQMDVLQRESQATGKSKSELIRVAIDAAYDPEADTARRMAAWQLFVNMKWPEATPEVLPRPKDWRERLHDRGHGDGGR